MFEEDRATAVHGRVPTLFRSQLNKIGKGL
jgi:hypothetical protein